MILLIDLATMAVMHPGGIPDVYKRQQFARNNGVYPNRILTTGDIWDLVEANKQIQYKMGQGSPKVLTQDKFLDFIGLKGDDIPPVKIMRSLASYNPGGVAGAEVDNVSIVGSNFYLFYACLLYTSRCV